MLEIKDLTIRYTTRPEPAVSSVSLEVGKGEFVLLTGDSASGKSTLMQAVCGFIPSIVPAKVTGRIEINGKELKDPIDVARTVCMVQQDPETQFCTETVREEVAFGPENFCRPRNEVIRAVEDSLRDVGASNLIDRKLSTLSGGEKQKVAIASVLALEPEVIILDEPTSSLDPRSVKEAVQAIRTLSSKNELTTIVVEHRVKQFLDLATRIVRMKEGRIVSDLPAKDFRTSSDGTSLSDYPKLVRRDQPVLSIEHLSYSIEGKDILKDVTLEVKDGSVVALMGENGAGKTTLLRHISGLARPDRGRVTVFGRVIGDGREADPWALAEDVGFVFQNPNHQIFGETVEKEIEFASVNFKRPLDRAKEAATKFASEEKVQVTTHPNCLSLGQKRRLNIVSSSAHGPRLLLLDEPFVGQDSTNAFKIAQMLASLQREGRTAIIVTHDLEFAEAFCTDIVLLDGGRVVAQGTSGEDLGKDANKILERWRND
jgi:energy-coupling factor transporter ATP-binding protein EcfA2